MRFFPLFCREIQLHFSAVPQQCKLPLQAVLQKGKKRQTHRTWQFTVREKFTLTPINQNIIPYKKISFFFPWNALQSSQLRNNHTTNGFARSSEQTRRAGERCYSLHIQGNGERWSSLPLRSQRRCCTNIHDKIVSKKLIYVLPASVHPALLPVVSLCYWILPIVSRCVSAQRKPTQRLLPSFSWPRHNSCQKKHETNTDILSGTRCTHI